MEPQAQEQPPPSPNPRRSSELRRGRFVDKNKEKPHTKIAARGQPQQPPQNNGQNGQSKLKRNDSLSKREKQDANHIIQRNSDNSSNLSTATANGRAAATKQMKTLANQGLHSVLS